jgi:omega-hydroxy-beta-dihydromenaquinone-9 sulfotransferase
VRPRLWEKLLVLLHKRLFSILGGISFGDWLRLLRDNDFAVDFPYWPRAALLTLTSVGQSLQRWREERAYGAAVAGTTVLPPLFILGHWRNGTTHLHYLLGLDGRFAYPSNFQVIFPHSFLTTETWNAPFMARFTPERRAQDNVCLEVGLPQEDEFALSILTPYSPYLAWAFPRREAHYERYLTFRDVPRVEVERWQAALRLFLQKLTWKSHRPLLLKSPTHTCRIRLLLELFPDARFVHIRRDPYTVFLSTRRLFETVLQNVGLQRCDRRRFDELVLRRYRLMYDVFFEERGLVPPDRFHELKFEDLEKDPVGQLRALYERLRLPDFEAVRPALEDYTRTHAGYRKNEYRALPGPLRRRVAEAWRRNFEEWGYPV